MQTRQHLSPEKCSRVIYFHLKDLKLSLQSQQGKKVLCTTHYQPDPSLCEDTCKVPHWFQLWMTNHELPFTKGARAYFHYLSQRWYLKDDMYVPSSTRILIANIHRLTHLSGYRGHSC